MSLTTLQNFYKVTLARRMATTGALSMYVSSLPTPSSGWLVISPSNSSLREIVKYSSTGTDANGTYVVISAAEDRGLGGTTAQTHEIGEPVRMNYTSLHQQETSDAIDQIVAAGAQDATTSVKGIAKLPRIETTAGNTHVLTTLAGERVIVWSAGNMSDANIGDHTLELKYDGTVKHTILVTQRANSVTTKHPYTFLHTFTPGAATANLTVTGTGGETLENNVFIIQII